MGFEGLRMASAAVQGIDWENRKVDLKAWNNLGSAGPEFLSEEDGAEED